jgi:chromate reductase
MPTILVLDGSLGAPDGNTSRLAKHLAAHLEPEAELRYYALRNSPPSVDALAKADAFVFATGTYWDSWGSPLQQFLEEATELEGGSVWLGKPTATLVTMHSVGGKEVLSRLQGVLSTLGLLIPPMSGMTYSLANHLALRQGGDQDFWRVEDLEVVAHNLLRALGKREGWRAWPVESEFDLNWL